MTDHTNVTHKTVTITFADITMEVTFSESNTAPSDVDPADPLLKLLELIRSPVLHCKLAHIRVGGVDIGRLIYPLLRAYPRFEETFFALIRDEIDKQENTVATNPAMMKDHPTCQ